MFYFYLQVKKEQVKIKTHQEYTVWNQFILNISLKKIKTLKWMKIIWQKKIDISMYVLLHINFLHIKKKNILGFL